GFVGRHRRPAFFRRAEFFCPPPQYDPFGIVSVEGMACGCRVVAPPAGGGREAVLDGETGILVPPLDVGAVTAALDRILTDASLRRRMGAAGRRHVEQVFAMDKYISRVLAVYHKAIEVSRQKLDRSREA